MAVFYTLSLKGNCMSVRVGLCSPNQHYTTESNPTQSNPTKPNPTQLT